MCLERVDGRRGGFQRNGWIFVVFNKIYEQKIIMVITMFWAGHGTGKTLSYTHH